MRLLGVKHKPTCVVDDSRKHKDPTERDTLGGYQFYDVLLMGLVPNTPTNPLMNHRLK